MNQIQNHSPKPYTIIEDSLLDCNLNIYEKMVLISIIKYAGKANRAWPGIKRLATTGGMSKRQAIRTLQDLKHLDLIRIETRAGRSNLYHIPQFIFDDGRLLPLWKPDSTPAPQSPHPCPPVSGGVPVSHEGVTDRHRGYDCQSPEYYQRSVSKKNSLFSESNVSPSPAPKNSGHQAKEPETNKRENFDSELIKTWSNHFSIQHKPDSIKEQIAMDWMLFASKSNQLYQIKSPIAYLKTITRKGHSQDFIPFQMRKSSTVTPVHLRPTAQAKWSCINQAYKQGLLLEAKEQGIPEGEIDFFAFQLFEKEYQQEQNQLRL